MSDGYSDPYWESDGEDESDVCPHGKGFDEKCWQCEQDQDEQEESYDRT